MFTLCHCVLLTDRMRFYGLLIVKNALEKYKTYTKDPYKHGIQTVYACAKEIPRMRNDWKG